MAERTLSQRELNRALLARQLLLERVRLPIPQATIHVVLAKSTRRPSCSRRST
jgi:hypothetical protein